jgi:hypothetical protein
MCWGIHQHLAYERAHDGLPIRIGPMRAPKAKPEITLADTDIVAAADMVALPVTTPTVVTLMVATPFMATMPKYVVGPTAVVTSR